MNKTRIRRGRPTSYAFANNRHQRPPGKLLFPQSGGIGNWNRHCLSRMSKNPNTPFNKDWRAAREDFEADWDGFDHTATRETNDARNTREFFEHRKLVLKRISAAIAYDKSKTNRRT